MKRPLGTLASGLLLLGLAAGAAESPPAESREILARAFANRYELDFTADIDLVMHSSTGQSRTRSFRALSKVIGDRTHSIGRLTAPNYLRGMTILTIEASERGHDSFVFLPSLSKVRRVSTAQRADSFLGSDVTYEDLERRRIEDYSLEPVQIETFEDEAVHTIWAVREAGDSPDRVQFVVAASDGAILETRHARANGSVYRIVNMPRSDMRALSGHLLPTRILVQQLARSSRTEVRFRNLVVNPEINDRIFSLATLDQNRPLPGEAR